MVALPDFLFVRRGGKSELHRAGWSVTRTVPSPKRRNMESATEKIPPTPHSGEFRVMSEELRVFDF